MNTFQQNTAALLVLFSVLLFASCTSVGSLSQLNMEGTDIPYGLAVGQEAPYVSARNQRGEYISWDPRRKARASLVFFYQGEWNDRCQQFMADLSDSLTLLTDRGVEVVAITPQREERALKEMSQIIGSRFDILVDDEGQIMREFDVDYRLSPEKSKEWRKEKGVDIAATNQQEYPVLPVPAAFVIDDMGMVVWRYFEYDHAKRVSIAQLLKQLPQ